MVEFRSHSFTLRRDRRSRSPLRRFRLPTRTEQSSRGATSLPKCRLDHDLNGGGRKRMSSAPTIRRRMAPAFGIIFTFAISSPRIPMRFSYLRDGGACASSIAVMPRLFRCWTSSRPLSVSSTSRSSSYRGGPADTIVAACDRVCSTLAWQPRSGGCCPVASLAGPRFSSERLIARSTISCTSASLNFRFCSGLGGAFRTTSFVHSTDGAGGFGSIQVASDFEGLCVCLSASLSPILDSRSTASSAARSALISAWDLFAGAARVACSAALLALNCAMMAIAISPVWPRPFPDRSKPITLPKSRPYSNIERIAVDRSAPSTSATLAIFLSIFGGKRTPTIGSWPVRGRPRFRARFCIRISVNTKKEARQSREPRRVTGATVPPRRAPTTASCTSPTAHRCAAAVRCH